MKRLLTILVLAIIILLPIRVMAQMDAYGLAGGGSMAQKGEEATLSLFAGFNVPIYTDTVKGFKSFNRTTVNYTEESSGETIQGGATWMIQQVGLEKWSLGLGSGLMWEVRDGEDIQEMGLKVEVGYAIKGSIGISVGADYFPARGEPARHLLYGMVDLFR